MRTRQTLDGLTQPVPSAPSLAPSTAHSSPDICASLLTTTVDGRTEGPSPFFTSASLHCSLPIQSARTKHWKSDHHRQKPKNMVCSPNLCSSSHRPSQIAPMSSPILLFLVSIARYMRKSRSLIIFIPLISSIQCSLRCRRDSHIVPGAYRLLAAGSLIHVENLGLVYQRCSDKRAQNPQDFLYPHARRYT